MFLREDVLSPNEGNDFKCGSDFFVLLIRLSRLVNMKNSLTKRGKEKVETELGSVHATLIGKAIKNCVPGVILFFI